MTLDCSEAVGFGLILRAVVANRTMIDQCSGLVLPRQGPCMVERDDRAGNVDRIGGIKRAANDRQLRCAIVRRSCGVTERKVGEDRARRIAGGSDAPGARDRRGRRSGSFECSCDQSN